MNYIHMSNDDSGGDDDGEKMKDTTNDHEMIILEQAIEGDRKVGCSKMSITQISALNYIF